MVVELTVVELTVVGRPAAYGSTSTPVSVDTLTVAPS